jgi:hypothetical protein
MLYCMTFKQMLVLTRPWALPNFGLGLVVLHGVHLTLEWSFILFWEDLFVQFKQDFTFET